MTLKPDKNEFPKYLEIEKKKQIWKYFQGLYMDTYLYRRYFPMKIGKSILHCRGSKRANQRDLNVRKQFNFRRAASFGLSLATWHSGQFVKMKIPMRNLIKR